MGSRPRDDLSSQPGGDELGLGYPGRCRRSLHESRCTRRATHSGIRPRSDRLSRPRARHSGRGFGHPQHRRGPKHHPRGSPKRFGLRKVRSRSPRKSVRTSGRRRHGDGGSADACGWFGWSVPGHRLVLTIRALASPAAPCRLLRCRWSPGASRPASESPSASARTGSPIRRSARRPSVRRH